MVGIYNHCHQHFFQRLFILLDQRLFILLDQPTAAVIAQNAEESILIVGEMGHTLDQIDMSMLRSLTWSVFWPTPQNNFEMMWDFSNFQPLAPPTLSGKWSLRAFRRSLLNWWTSHCQRGPTPCSPYSIPMIWQGHYQFLCLNPQPGSVCTIESPGQPFWSGRSWRKPAKYIIDKNQVYTETMP